MEELNKNINTSEEEIIDLDNITDEEIDDSNEIKKKNKKSKKKNNDDEFSFDIKGLLLKTVLPVILTLIGTVILMTTILKPSANTNTTENQEDVEIVQAINDNISLDEYFSELQDSQTKALQVQFDDLTEKYRTTDDTKINYSALTIAGLNGQTMNTLDKFFDIYLKVKNNASSGDINVAKKQLLPFVAENDDENLSKDNIVLDNLFKQETISKQLNKNGIKSGSAFSALIGEDANSNKVLLTTMPYSTEDTYVNVQYLIKVDKDNVLLDIKYIGYIQNTNKEQSKLFYKNLESILKQMPKKDPRGINLKEPTKK